MSSPSDTAVDILSLSNDDIVDLAQRAPLLHSVGGIDIHHLSSCLVLKSGSAIQMSEAKTMQFVAERCPDVRIPKVHRYFQIDPPDPDSRASGYILMDYIDGQSLDKVWSTLSESAKKDVVDQVSRMVSDLQSVHLDTPGVIGGGVSHGYFFSDYGTGPFNSRELFHKWINWKLIVSKQFNRAPQDLPEIHYHDFVLVHGDLSPRNLILDPKGCVWLIDWGCAGVYPPIFESATLKHQLHFPDFAQLLLPLIYINSAELYQLERCAHVIRYVYSALPPELLPPELRVGE